MIRYDAKKENECHGLISITRPSGGDDGDNLAKISIIDGLTGLTLATISIELQEFMAALMGACRRGCEIKAYPGGVEMMGRVLETKIMRLPCGTDDEGRSTYPSTATLHKHEVDGWIADRGEYNPHQVCYKSGDVKKPLHRVNFRRFVESTEGRRDEESR